MNKYDEMLEWIASGTNSLVVAMLSIMYYIIQAEGMDATHLADIMGRIDMSFDTGTKILTSGTKTYTTYDMINAVITTLYKPSLVITSEFIFWSIYKAQRRGYITSGEATTLKAALANA